MLIELTTWNPTHLPVLLLISRIENKPNPTSETAHPRAFTHRYFWVICTKAPPVTANNEMTSGLARNRTLERMGDAPKHAWKYTGR